MTDNRGNVNYLRKRTKEDDRLDELRRLIELGHSTELVVWIRMIATNLKSRIEVAEYEK